MNANFEQQIQAELMGLEQNAQQRVLAFVRSLRKESAKSPHAGVASLAGAISSADLAAMSAAIEQGCEQVDPHEW